MSGRLGSTYHNFDDLAPVDADPFKIIYLTFGADSGVQYNIIEKLSILGGIQINHESSLYQEDISPVIMFKPMFGLKYNFGPKQEQS